jgi:hypothetical protein
MSTPTNEKSGKLLIVGVLAIGVAAAAASWWFRYSATHHAAQFWGPQAAALIRDAPHVTLRSDTPSADGSSGDVADVPRDISSAKGLTHLRTALQEDASFDWTAAGPPDTNWSNSLVFAASEGAAPRAVVMFSPDFSWAADGSAAEPAKHAVSTAPIAKGLKEFFAEQAEEARPEQ